LTAPSPPPKGSIDPAETPAETEVGMPGRQSSAAWLLALAAVQAAATAAALAFWLLAEPALSLPLILVAAAGVLAPWIAATLIRRHFAALARLREAVVGSAGAAGAWTPPRAADEPEVDALAQAIGAMSGAACDASHAGDARLAAVIAALPECIVVVTETGLVSLVNDNARHILGARALDPGTSVFDALTRESFAAAWDQARAAGRPVDTTVACADGRVLPLRIADFAGHRGAILAFRSDLPAAALQHDLQLHDQPQPPVPVGDDTPLADLPAVVIDVETTGLDPRRDRVLALGAVRLTGGRRHRGVALDVLCNPGVPIPAAATAVHGLDDATVRAAPAFAAHHDALRAVAAGCVVIGHNIGFDLAAIAAECARAGLAWSEPPRLDTLLLAAALRLDLDDLNLESIALWLGVVPVGRHTALGDALLTAEIWARLLPLLAEAGVATFGAATAFARRPRRVLALQREAGW